MKHWLFYLSALFSFFFLSAGAYAEIPAFPGAQGGGSLAKGGRGGQVCAVTNLNDSGPGSLRECVVETSGPRTVIFRVGGTIYLNNYLLIQNPYLTIAGQTAPGGGIQLAPGPDMERTLIIVNTHNVIIRYMRLRQSRDVPRDRSPSVLTLTDTNSQLVSDVMLDHLSMFWSPETTTGATGRGINTAPRNVTWQYVLIAESLEGHSTGMRIGGLGAGSDTSSNKPVYAMNDIDVHNTMFAHNGHRNAMFKPARGRWINNIVYDWNMWATRGGTGLHGDFISNIWRKGPSSKSSRGNQDVAFWRWTEDMTSPDRDIHDRPNSIYLEGNEGDMTGMSPDADNWPYTREVGQNMNSGTIQSPAPVEWRRYEPLEAVGVPIAIRPVSQLEDHLLPIVGASQRLDCSGNWVLNRDSADKRIIAQYKTNTGYAPVAHENDVGGFPLIKGGDACVDSSGDGIADEWAIANGLDHRDASLGATIHSSGYSFLELYLNGMQVGQAPPATPSGVLVE